MTPQQTKAMNSAVRITDAAVRARAIMLIMADNVQGMYALRDELIWAQASIWNRLRVANILQIYKNGRGTHDT